MVHPGALRGAMGPVSFVLFCFFKDFIHIFDKQRSQVGREAGRERKRERRKQASRQAGSPIWGSIPGSWDHDPSRRQRL